MHSLLRSRAVGRLVSTATLISLLAGFFSFIPTSPVFAVADDPLESLSTTLAQPVFSADWDTNPSYTNVSYSWALTQGITAQGTDPCLPTGSCVSISIDLSDLAPTSTHQSQEWMSTVTVTDFVWSGPANTAVSSTQRVDNDGNGRYEGLEILIGCSATCTFATSTEYSFSIVNNPLKNPEGNGTPGVYTTTTHSVYIQDGTDFPANTPETLSSIVVIGEGLQATASVDASLSFNIQGYETPSSYFFDNVDIDNSLASNTCDFGLLTPGTAKVCAWFLNVSTNAENGYSVYVVQDQDMTFNGNTIKQYESGTRTDDAGANTWQSPSSASLAHLGYSSNDSSVFLPASGSARWAGIPTIAGAGQTPEITGLVADSASAGDDQYTYALKVESAPTLPQAVAANSQAYSHNEYFIVVGNF